MLGQAAGAESSQCRLPQAVETHTFLKMNVLQHALVQAALLRLPVEKSLCAKRQTQPAVAVQI